MKSLLPTLSVVILITVLWCLLGRVCKGQLVGLRHPESPNSHRHNGLPSIQRPPQSNQQSQQQQNPSRPARFSARPGNVIVHFNRNHDIQQLQYVLQDGRLAELYHQRPNSASGPLPVLQRAAGGGQFAPSLARSSSEQGSGINNNQTIDIMDEAGHLVAKMVGDHMTLNIPATKSDSSLENFALKKSNIHSLDEDDEGEIKVSVLATVAQDMLSKGAKKMGHMMVDKLRHKVNEKLRELPEIIEKKLKEKSSGGHKFVEQQVSNGNELVVVSEPVDMGGEVSRQLVTSSSGLGATTPEQTTDVMSGQAPESVGGRRLYMRF